MGAERFLGCRVDRKSGADEDDDFSLEGFHHDLDDEQEDSISDDDCGGQAEERRIYWESQHLLLQVPPPNQLNPLFTISTFFISECRLAWSLGGSVIAVALEINS